MLAHRHTETKKIIIHQTDATSTNALWIRNCSTCSKPMTSHVLGWLAGSRRAMLHVH